MALLLAVLCVQPRVGLHDLQGDAAVAVVADLSAQDVAEDEARGLAALDELPDDSLGLRAWSWMPRAPRYASTAEIAPLRDDASCLTLLRPPRV